MGHDAHTYNPSTREAKAGASQVQSQLGLHITTWPQKQEEINRAEPATLLADKTVREKLLLVIERSQHNEH